VSNILNGRANVGAEARQRVLQCVKDTGYQPNYFAQSMRKQNSRVISIITEDLTTFGTNPMVEAIMAYCEENEYRTILMNQRLYRKWGSSWYNENKKLRTAVEPLLQEALSIRVDGVVYVAGHCRYIDCFPEKFSIPAVIAYAISKGNKYPSVIIDDEKGGYDIAKYLVSKGHRNIGVISGAVDNLHAKSRLLGYQKALFEEGVPFNPSWVYYGQWHRDSGYEGAKKLVSDGITALFCMNDDMAAGAYDYLYEQRLEIGRDISIIGYDNMELSDYLRPRLTTNEIPLGEIGKKAAEILLGALSGESAEGQSASTIRVPCRMVERESVATIE
jgi:LacI family transcriptional regulator